MSLLEMRLMGGFALHYDEQPLMSLYQSRERALLAYLALHAQKPLARAFLAFHFWPDSTEKQARTNLRHSLFQFRQRFSALGDYLQLESDTVQWRTELPFLVDVLEIETALASVTPQATSAEMCAALTVVQQRYNGEFMSGFYEEWILNMRERLRQTYCQALRHAVKRFEAERDYLAATNYAHVLLNLDPVDELTYRMLMQLRALQGDLTGALQLYHDCVATLHDMLEVAPEPQTTALYNQLASQRARPHSSSSQESSRASVASPDPFIGRHTEWQQLQEAWRTCESGGAHFVLITGEAGIGKTRLAEEMLQWAERLQVPTARAKAYAAEGRLPYAPIIAWLRSPTLQQQQAALARKYLAELGRLLPELLAQDPTLPIPTPLTDTWQRQTLFDAMVEAILPRQGGVVLLLDDLQWCDQETLEWLHYLLRHAAVSLLVLSTVRLEELTVEHPLRILQHNMQADSTLTTIDLLPLDAQESCTLATQIATAPLPESQLVHLHAYSGGIPLFIVEMVRAELDMRPTKRDVGLGIPLGATESTDLQRFVLPSKVQALIQTRLAPLSVAARELIELAAVIGRDFSVELLAQAAQMNVDMALALLDELWQRCLLLEGDEQRYDIAHDRIRDVVYQAISPLRKRQLHWRVAQAIEVHHGIDLSAVSGQLAGHYEQAGFFVRAIPYYQQAGEDAQQIFANGEAIGYYRRGLHLLKELPSTTARNQQELALLIALGVTLVSQLGYAANSVRETYLLANALCQKLDGSAHGPILRALAISAATRGEFARAYTYGKQLLERAQQHQDPILTVEAYYSLGVTVFWQGRFAESARHLRCAIDGYRSTNRAAHLKLFAQDPLPICQARYAGALWHLGDPEQAEVWINRAVQTAEAEGHPHTVSYVLFWQALILHFNGDFVRTKVAAQRATNYAEKYQLPFWSNEALILLGWAEVHQAFSSMASTRDEVIVGGIAKIKCGIDALRAIDMKFFLAYYTGLLAEIQEKNGNHAEGAGLLTAALNQARAHHEGWCQAKLLQLQGDLCHHGEPNDNSASKVLYQQALSLARQQEAKAWELEIETSLSQIRGKCS